MDKPIAAALRYDDTLPAPFVTATGRGQHAERMLQLARQHGVPVQNAPELAERLVFLETRQVIPEELYQPVAEIFAFIMKINESFVRKNDRNNEIDPRK